MSTDADRAAELRNAMVDDIAADHEAKELTLRPEVEAALRTVPRHLFTPGVSMEEAYAATSSIITKQLPSGESISSVSAPYLIAEEKAIASGLVAPSWPYGTSATWHNGTLAYRTIRWTDRRFDLGAYAHGPDAQAAAERMVEDMRAWAEAGCPTPALEVFPIDTPDSDLPDGAVLDKRHSRLVVSFR